MHRALGLDHHGRCRRSRCHAHHLIGTGEREARDFSRNGGEAVEGLRRQRRKLAHAASALRACARQRRPHQAQAAGIRLKADSSFQFRKYPPKQILLGRVFCELAWPLAFPPTLDAGSLDYGFKLKIAPTVPFCSVSLSEHIVGSGCKKGDTQGLGATGGLQLADHPPNFWTGVALRKTHEFNT